MSFRADCYATMTKRSHCIKTRKPLRWKRTILPIDWNSDYLSWDGRTKYKILRNRKTSRVQLFIWRDSRETHSEKYDYLPSVRFAKQFAETRRDEIEVTLKNGRKKIIKNEMTW